MKVAQLTLGPPEIVKYIAPGTRMTQDEEFVDCRGAESGSVRRKQV